MIAPIELSGLVSVDLRKVNEYGARASYLVDEFVDGFDASCDDDDDDYDCDGDDDDYDCTLKSQFRNANPQKHKITHVLRLFFYFPRALNTGTCIT